MGSTQWFSRRDFLKTAGAFSIASYAMWMGGCESCQKQIAARPTRRNVANLASNDPIIQAYQAAISAMKALPASNPLSWQYQATIHNNHCPHGNWWFLPWHRVYLLYFERIIRKMSGNNDFALPYWNWTTSPSIPPIFWGNGNPMFDSNRTKGPSDMVPSSAVGSSVITGILGQPDFQLFGSASQVASNFRASSMFGELEGTPHNTVHGWIGGDMGTYMSPLDPVFWCHHNVLDCLWYKWNEMGNGNTSDPNWGNYHFTEFFDENGNAVDVACALTPLYPLFTYQFEPCDQGGGASGMAKALNKDQLEALLKNGSPAKLEVTQQVPLQRELNLAIGKPARSTAKISAQALRDAIEPHSNRVAVLNVNEIVAPETNDYFVRVFAGKPDATPDTPITDPHYAGGFAFFQDAKAMAGMPNMSGHKFGQVVDLTSTLRRLNQNGGLPTDSLDITLVPVAYEGRNAENQRLSIGSLELTIAQVK